MRNTIIHFEKNGYRIIGNVNFILPGLAEVRLICPFDVFTIRGNFPTAMEESDDEQQRNLRTLTEYAFEICRTLHMHNEPIKADFLKLTDTLDKFNNKKTEDYQRNRDELMKIFMKRYFSTSNEFNRPEEGDAEEIFNFLALYFLKNGKCAELDIRTRFTEKPQPPNFTELEGELKGYLEKSEYERVELLAEQILTKRTGKYDWFIQQEFFAQKTH